MKCGPLSNGRFSVHKSAAIVDLSGGVRVAALILGVGVLWALTRRFQGLAQDGEIYAAQAFARIHPNLAADLYLAHTSQDSFTVFSHLYERLIGWWGLPAADTTLCSWLCLGCLPGGRMVPGSLSRR